MWFDLETVGKRILTLSAWNVSLCLVSAHVLRLPTSRFHHHLLGLIGFGMFFDGFEIGMTLVVGVALVETGWLTVSEIVRFAPVA